MTQLFWRFVFFLSLVSGAGKIQAQGPEIPYPQISIGIGYFGELLTHPGIVLFGEYALSQSRNQIAGRINLISYRHRGHTRSHMVLPEIVLRRYTQKRNYWEASLGSGWLYQLADAQVLEYQEGNFEAVKSGWSYWTPSLGLRYGKSFQLGNDHFLTPNLGTRFYYQYPFNDAQVLRAAVALSLSYQIK